MKLIQFVLLALFAAWILIYFRKLRSLFFDRLIVLFFTLAGALFVVMPDWTMQIARWMGVGRGADLVIYFSLVGFIFIFLMLFLKIRDLEIRLTNLARFEAIEHARRALPQDPEGPRTGKERED